MPDPTAHADDMKSPAKHETMPPLWWLEPWTFAVQQWNARAKYYRYWQVTEAQRELALAEASAKSFRISATDSAILETANAAGFEASKVGYAINGQPCSPFPLTWLGEAVAYWKGEAYAARRERDNAKTDHNAFQRQVEVTLEAALHPEQIRPAYENTIDLVICVAEELKALRTLSGNLNNETDALKKDLAEAKAALAGMTEDRDAYVAKYQALQDKIEADKKNPWIKDNEIERLRAELDAALKRGSELQDKCRLIHGNHQGDVWAIKTAENKYGDLRDGYAAYAGMMLGHMHSPNQPAKPKRKPAKKKAKKKGARRA